MGRATVTIKAFDVFLDLREQGFGDVIGGKLFTEDDGALSFHFGHSLISDYCEDDWVGTPRMLCARATAVRRGASRR